MKKIIYLVAAFLCMACSDDHGSNQENGGASGSVTEVTRVTSDLSVDLSTDKAFYKPGEKVVFTAEDALPAMNWIVSTPSTHAIWKRFVRILDKLTTMQTS